MEKEARPTFSNGRWLVKNNRERKKKINEGEAPHKTTADFLLFHRFQCRKGKYGSMYVVFIYTFNIYLPRTTEKSLHNTCTQWRVICRKKAIQSLVWASILGLNSGSKVVVCYARGIWFPVLARVNFTLCTNNKVSDSQQCQKAPELCKALKHYCLFFTMQDKKGTPFQIRKRRQKRKQ